jgi:hypothetical protein
MSLRPHRRALRGIERDLACSDPHLNMLFASFTHLAGGTKMPRIEMIGAWPVRLVRWLGRRADRYLEGTDGRARPRTLP